ncbi:helix-turn-helix domain-containing protein [Myxococcota bacterium]
MPRPPCLIGRVSGQTTGKCYGRCLRENAGSAPEEVPFVDRKVVQRWRKRFLEGGERALLDKPRSGRLPTLFPFHGCGSTTHKIGDLLDRLSPIGGQKYAGPLGDANGVEPRQSGTRFCQMR